PQIAREDPKRGRFAGAVEAEKPDGLAVVDLERHRAERALAAIKFRQVVCTYHRQETSLARGRKSLGFISASPASMSSERGPGWRPRKPLLTSGSSPINKV